MKPRRQLSHKFIFHLVYQEITCALLISWVLFFLCCDKRSFWHAAKSNKDVPVYCAHKSFCPSHPPRLPPQHQCQSELLAFASVGHFFQTRSGSVFSNFWNVLLFMNACRHQVRVIASWFDITGDTESASTKIKWKECKCTNVYRSASGRGVSTSCVCRKLLLYRWIFSVLRVKESFSNSTGLLELFCMYVGQKGLVFLYITISTCDWF